MRLVTFGSGSGGNCALIRDGESSVLMDAGLSYKSIAAGLAREGLGMGEVGGVLITHEHSDHVSALSMLLRHSPVPVYAPRTVANHLLRALPGLEEHIRIITVGEPFFVKELTVTAFSTPHDTDQSVGYLVEGTARLGFCTDTGCVTNTMLSALRGCDAALIEANHDVDMLRYGRYPVYLKRRILSDRGHLSNEDSGAFACALAESGTETIVLGHLSRENNTPARAWSAVRAALDGAGFSHVALHVAPRKGDLALEILPCCVSA